MASTIYVNHRESQREWILECAEDLFIEKGIQPITLAHIAKAARLTRATVYKYFPNKEQIAQTIFRMITRGWTERNAAEVWGMPGTGYQRLERFLTSHFDHLFQHPREARFVAEFNTLYAKELSVAQMAGILSETLDGERMHVLEAVRSGQQDGSLRTDTDPELMVAATLNFTSSVMSRLGEMGDKVGEEFQMDAQQVFRQTHRFFLDGLRAPAER